VPIAKRERTCGTCKQVFIDPESFRKHKYMDGICRKPEALTAAGFENTPKGWRIVRLKRSV
jgi:hypothetical protein